ncbi:MAG: HAD-IA family hydrolase [Gemmatimonadota bacterium]|nr:HAD-IA family hydrolase [Gemmatimonadota bacterium]
MPPALLFDLDGTLIDSIELILSSARYAFEGFQGRAPTDDEWRALIGRPLTDSFREFVPDEPEIERLIARYREHQLLHHDRLVHAYDGVVAVIRQFARAGYPMALVTSKADWLARRALVHVGLDAVIRVIVGCDSTSRHKPHPEPVYHALSLLRAEAKDAIFVGDSPHDVEAGQGAGVYTIGVTWGAFTVEEMTRSGADLVIHDIQQLPPVVERFAAKIA